MPVYPVCVLLYRHFLHLRILFKLCLSCCTSPSLDLLLQSSRFIMCLHVCSNPTHRTVMNVTTKTCNNHPMLMRECMTCVCVGLDGTSRGTSLWFSGAHPPNWAETPGASKRTRLPEKHQYIGSAPAHSSCLASAVHQPCYCAAHTTERASWGTHTLTHTVLFAFSLIKHWHWHFLMSRFALQTFLVRKSRTSQKNVLCVRLADDSMPSFVQQFGIREEQSSKSLTSWLYNLASVYIKLRAIKTKAAFFVTESYNYIKTVRYTV